VTTATVEKYLGYITQAKYLRSQSTREIELRIGYRAGRLAEGYSLWFLLDRLTPEDFEFRGYSQMSGGVPMGHKPAHSDDPNAEQSLLAEGYDLAALKRRICDQTFRYVGPDWLCKVIPIREKFGDKDYPQGTGIPQWEIVRDRPKRFQLAAVVPGDGKYTGNYI
jgi:hypothetical protein